MVRTVWAYFVGLVVTAYWSVRLLSHQAWVSRRPDGAQRQLVVGAKALKGWSRGILWGAGAKVEYEDDHLLPVGIPHILVANHQSWFDVFALAGTLKADVRFVGKKELAEIFMFGPAWLSAGHYAIDRSDRQAAINSLATIVDRMHEQSHAVVLFPEGTRSKDGTLGLFKKGAFVMAINAQVPVVPLAVTGSKEIMPKGSWKVRRGVVKVRVGAPIPTEGLTLEDRNDLTRTAKRRVAELLEASGGPPSKLQGPGGSAEEDPATPLVPQGTPVANSP
ncbi:MAG: lysophospholipid acyltransferase family protein [Longimicrobiales bacterium]